MDIANLRRVPPKLADHIEVLNDDGSHFFVGTITEVANEFDGMLQTVRMVAKDAQHEFDSLTVNETYKQQTVKQIITSIVTKYAPTFDATGVECDVLMDQMKFSDLKPSECVNKILDQLGDHVWYIDADKKINLFKKYTRSAPFDLTQGNDTFSGSSLRIKRNIDQLRNSIYVKGGPMVGTQFTNNISANGTTKAFSVGANLENWTFSIGGSALPVKDESVVPNADYTYNPKTGLLKFLTAPTSGTTIVVTAQPKTDIKIIRKDVASIAKYGERQHRITDESIVTIAAAKQRAKAEIAKYAERINEGTFTTHKDGLDPGQQLYINLPSFGLNDYFIIKQVITHFTGTKDGVSVWEHEVQLVASEILGMTDVLTKLLINDPADRQLNTGEVLIDTYYFSEEVISVDSFTARTYPRSTPTFSDTLGPSETIRVNPWGTSEPTPVATPYYPQSSADRKRQFKADAGIKVY